MSEAYYIYVLKEYEKKLSELMGDKYFEFARNVAKAGFKAEIENMSECDFKNFVLDNFNDITR